MKIFIASSFAFVAMLLSSVAHATIYLYQMPDGSRIISDKPMINTEAKLVRRSKGMERMGHYAAHRSMRFKRERRRLAYLIHQESNNYGVDEALVNAVIHTESYYNPHATSHKGASGLMQLMPATAEKYGVYDLYNPKQNIKAGIQHLRELIDMFPDNLRHAIAAYNAGINAVKKYNGIPPYRETQGYVRKVMKRFNEYRYGPRQL